MPDFNIVKRSNVARTFRNDSIKSQYDLKIENEVSEKFSGTIDLENKSWNVGLIVGSSGSGKSTIAKSLFPDEYIDQLQYDAAKSVLDCMPAGLETNKITEVFNSVGFGTVWSWLKPYHVLSTGERMRVDIARCILENRTMFVFDEFTSVVNRTIAQHASFAISKFIKKQDKKFIAVSCHYDIIDWLEPDWIYDTDKREFFFAQERTRDPQSKSKFAELIMPRGSSLKSITI